MSRPLARIASISLLLTMTACGEDGGDGTSTTATTATAGTATSSTSTATVDPTGSTDAPTSGDPSTTGATAVDTGDTTASTTTGELSLGSDSSDTGSTSSTTSDTTGAPSDTDTSGSSSDTGSTSGMQLRVLQLNLCHSGVAGCFTGDAVMKKAVAVIKSVDPGLVTLNEVCRDDVPYLAAQTGALDGRFTPALKGDGTPVKCKNGDDYGNGLLSWFEPAWAKPVTGVYSTQSSMTERRVWICMGYEGFVGCTTHLSTNGATALAQCKEFVGGPLATAAADGPAVMAGDWNLKYKGSPNAQDCVPNGFYRKGDGAVQHLIASIDLGFLETVIIDMDGTTDHPGLEVRMTLP